MVSLKNYWDILLKNEWEKQYYLKLRNILIKEYEEKNVFPEKKNIFNALKLTDFKNCKVIILGQDPYHTKGLADGLCFSVPENSKIPPSLVNILKETERDLKIKQPKNFGCLKEWAKKGVLLLNCSLTVVESKPNSHSKIGWQHLTDKIISILNNKKTPIVFLLWGNFAISKQKLINNKIHLVLKSSHPSPLSAFRGFLGCGHFSKTNNFLIKTKQEPINWKLNIPQ